MTVAEQAWCDAITRIGCIVCYLLGYPRTPGAVHHLKEGGRRVLREGAQVDHTQTICLCDPGHHQNPPADSGKIARHPTKARFEAAYGTEAELHALTVRLVAAEQARAVA